MGETEKQLLVNIARSCSHRETCHCCEGLAPVREKHAATFFLVLAGGPPKEGEDWDIDRPFRLRQPMEGEGPLYVCQEALEGGGNSWIWPICKGCLLCSVDLVLLRPCLASFRFINPARGSDARDKKKTSCRFNSGRGPPTHANYSSSPRQGTPVPQKLSAISSIAGTVLA